MSIKDLRPHYSEIIATVMDGDAIFTDTMNLFLDDLIDAVDATPAGDVTIKCGSRINGDGLIQFGSRV